MRLQAAGAAAAMTGEAVKLAPADADVLGEIVERAATPPQKSSLASRLKRLRTAGAAVMVENAAKQDELELDGKQEHDTAPPGGRAWGRFVMP